MGEEQVKPLRVVFDCGAEFKGTSLNNQLLQGPNLTSSLLGVLTQFRQESVAVMADVQSMFHQVKVAPEHLDFFEVFVVARRKLSICLEQCPLLVVHIMP